MKILLDLLIFILTVLIVIIINEVFFKKRKYVKEKLYYIQNLGSLYEQEADEDVFRKPLSDRLVKPTYNNFLKFIGKVAPKQIKKKYGIMISNAGFIKNMTAARIIAIQIMFALFLGGLLFLIIHKSGKNSIALVIFSTVMGFVMPIGVVKSEADKRKKKIRQALPDLLDLLYVSVEAGLGFDMALKKTADKMIGPLSEEVNKTLDEISRGRERQEALRGMINRTGVDDLSYFVTSVIQTEQLGSNIANMLKIQSTSMRQKRRQRAEEAAMKLPIKMLFPIIFFIFPTLFIVVLGPAVIRIINTLGNIF